MRVLSKKNPINNITHPKIPKKLINKNLKNTPPYKQPQKNNVHPIGNKIS